MTSKLSSRRNYLKVIGAGATVGLAGCSSGNSGGSGGKSSSTGSSSGSSGGSGGGQVTIGYLGPETSDIGKGGLNAAKIAVKDINANGGINGGDVKLVTGDTQSQPSQASSLIKKMVHGDNVDAIIGMFSSEAVLGNMDLLANSGVPTMTTGAGSPKITENYMGKNYEKYKNIFRVSPLNAQHQADAMAQYADLLNKQQGWSSFAIVAEDLTWNEPVSNNLPGMLKNKGYEVTRNTRISPKTNSFAPILDKVKSSGADVMLTAIAHLSGAGMLSQWRQNKYPFAVEGINIAGTSPSYWGDTNGGCAAEGVVTAGPAGVANVSKKTEPFIKEYKNQYGDSRPAIPMYMGMGTYDAMHVYKAAAEAVGSTDYHQQGDAIVSKISGTSMTGVTGHLEFHQKGEQYANGIKYGADNVPVIINQWQEASDGNGIAGSGGKKVTVFPQKYATGKHVKPSWL